MIKRITVIEVNKLSTVPPVLNLLQNLLSNNYKVSFIGYKKEDIPDTILRNKSFKFLELSSYYDEYEGKFERYRSRLLLSKQAKRYVDWSMQESDILWITSYNSIKMLGKIVFRYKYILQLMELVDKGYLYKRIIQFPIGEYARKAYKVVVPEINRAYIERTWWGLDKLPSILPNKPYTIDKVEVDDELQKMVDVLKKEKKKVILYLGGIWADRDLRPFAKSLKESDKYRLYIVGKAFGSSAEKQLDELIKQYNVVYLGNYKPPKHLEFVKYAHIGFLSYVAVPGDSIQSLNALYCAPNKIYEYAAFGVPMIGNDILGLKEPFEQNEIGVCCNEDDKDDVIKKLCFIEENYIQMKNNCISFYNSVDLNEIIRNILS